MKQQQLKIANRILEKEKAIFKCNNLEEISLNSER